MKLQYVPTRLQIEAAKVTVAASQQIDMEIDPVVYEIAAWPIDKADPGDGPRIPVSEAS
jgi:hypothetical protein